jgi:hypothetical protein
MTVLGAMAEEGKRIREEKGKLAPPIPLPLGTKEEESEWPT